MYRFIIVLLIVSILSVSVAAETKIFLERAKLDLPSIATSLFTKSPWIHTGLVVDGVVIETGVTNLKVHTNKMDNVIFLDVDINLTKKEAIRRAENKFDHFASHMDLIKIFSNRLLGTNFKTEGTTCSELVAHILGVKNPRDIVPKDFVQKDLSCSNKTCKFIP